MVFGTLSIFHLYFHALLDFSYTFLTGAIFVEASLINTNFEHCMLSCANFAGADLTGANLENAYVEYADFRGAIGLSEEDLADLNNRGAIVYDRNE